MKGQAQILAGIATVIFIAVMVLVGSLVFAYVADITPHDRTIHNESICGTTCINGSTSGTARTYQFDYIPVLDDATMICYNNSANKTLTNIMTNAGAGAVCGEYDIENNNAINISNTSAPNGCNVTGVECTYTYNWANANEQAFFNTNTTNTYAAFVLAAVLVIVLAAVVIVGIVLLMRG